MKVVLVTIAVVVFGLVPVLIWRGSRLSMAVIAAALFLTQVALLMHMHNLGRVVMTDVIEMGGPVREISEALLALKTAQWPAAIALTLCGVGMVALAAASHRRLGERQAMRPSESSPR